MQELPEGLVQIGPLALALPSEVVLPSDIRPAFAAARLGRAFLEGEPLALRVCGDGVIDAKEAAQIVEVGLGCGAFLELDVALLVDEVLRRHAKSHSKYPRLIKR